jgi:Cytochrome P460
MKRAFTAALLFVFVPFVAAAIAQPGAEDATSKMELESLLHVPAANYRQEWVLLGSFSVRADEPEKGAKELHVVYARPETVKAYRKTGAFPDGAVLVKDVFATKTEALTTGIASYADTLKGRFVLVKDKTGKNAGKSPSWGDGWGWAFYEGTETQKTVTTDFRKDCLGCHEPARSQDLIYVQGYPVLKR